MEKITYDEALISNNYDKFKFYTKFLETSFLWACISATNPTHLMDGTEIQDLSQLAVRTQNLCVNTFPTSNGVWISLVWRAEDELISRYVETFDSGPSVGSCLAICLLNSENVFFSPSRWQQLKQHDQAQILRLMRFGIGGEYEIFPLESVKSVIQAFK